MPCRGVSACSPCGDSIEHVSDPETLLHACHQHLAPGSVLLLETPDEGTLLRAIIRAVGKLGVPGFDPRGGIYCREHHFLLHAPGHAPSADALRFCAGAVL